ncbi:acyl-CoA dehydrogenase family protein [Streptomyces albus]|uniref:acyl-CoA dehydrogenase family protein n=1 Tax=Streptomyces sp. NRRL F-5917 TaxID=1463873 RepID=UPI0004C170B0|nr:acyl-CoA dehydrogenase family protein [Streptomyces sp. NRRL F-5917]
MTTARPRSRGAPDSPAAPPPWTEGLELTDEQRTAQAGFADFARREILPHADRWDREEHLPGEVVRALADEGHLGAWAPREHGGAGLDPVTFGLLNEALGHACSSVRSLLTVHSMVIRAVTRWGGSRLRSRWLPALASGTAVGAFALTEPEAGSDVASLRTAAEKTADGYRLTGGKRWITFGQAADVFVVFARCDDGPAAFLVERDAPGCTVEPVTGMLGTRAAMTAHLHFDGCAVPAEALVGRAGFGLNAVAADALETGRYSVAWGSAGLARACVEASARHAAAREQFGRPLAQHELVQRLITEMAVNTSAARLLCLRAGRLLHSADPQAVEAVWSAKYFAARSAFRAAADAVQVHGARGCGPDAPVQRLLRDAKIMEIIEGTTEIQQTVIAQSVVRELDGPAGLSAPAQNRGVHSGG